MNKVEINNIGYLIKADTLYIFHRFDQTEDIPMYNRDNLNIEYPAQIPIENYIINLNHSMLTEPKAIKAIEWLNQYKMKASFDIYPEVIVYSEKLKICGTIDLLLFNKTNNKYVIMDWKTSKRISSKAFKNKKGNHPVTSNLDDCNFNHYSLQLSLFRYILET